MPLAPKKLAIYYGWPSTVNATYSVSGAASVFNDYDLVVFGAGLESSSHGDHQNTEDIINHENMSGTQVFGYVTANQTIADAKSKIDDWHDMSVAGIFLDEFGYDFGVSRSDQNELVDYIHNKSNPSLIAFVNSWKIEDAIENAVDATYNPSGTAHKLQSTDWYLAESFATKDNAYDDTDADTDGTPDWVEKADEMATHTSDIQIACIGTTGASTAGFTQAKADYSFWATSMYGFDAWGWGEKNYSSAGGADSLPYRTRKTLPEGDALHGSSVSKSGDVLERNTNVGFHLDFDAHTLNTRLD